jgi:ABC-type polysaccharide/polyol phosphate transport system ATPase subunit
VVSRSTTVSVAASRPGETTARPGAGGPRAVSAMGVSKAFRLPHQRYSTLKERALHPFTSSTYDTLQALGDVSFDVGVGEFFGIVGRNGSGKSTLLKCLAGIYGVDSGEIQIDGRLSPFIELGVGFNPDLTARDNVMLNAIMLGLTRREARRRFDEIIEFAELQEFIDMKLKNYSSGMSVRLGFSVAVQVDADVLLVDEVLAVGDASFQRKCFDEFDRMRSEGRTILFVTHDMNSVERFCDRAMLLEQGELMTIGAPDEVARRYNEVNFAKPATDGGEVAYPEAGRDARILKTWCESASGERLVVAQQGDTCLACIEVEFLAPVNEPLFVVTFRSEARQAVFVAHSAGQLVTGGFAAGERATIRFAFDNFLAPGRYTLTPEMAVWDPEHRLLDLRDDVAALIVESSNRSGGMADLPTRVEIERS